MTTETTIGCHWDEQRRMRSTVRDALAGVDGVKDILVHLGNGRVQVEDDPDIAPVGALRRTLDEAGYPARPALRKPCRLRVHALQPTIAT